MMESRNAVYFSDSVLPYLVFLVLKIAFSCGNTLDPDLLLVRPGQVCSAGVER